MFAQVFVVVSEYGGLSISWGSSIGPGVPVLFTHNKLRVAPRTILILCFPFLACVAVFF